MNIQNKELSYYRLRLQELLNTSFPEKAHDVQFIDQRSSWAANAYEGAFIAGNPAVQCDDIALHILFEGLYFSRFDTIFQVVCNEFDRRMADEELRPFSLKMLIVCSAVFSNYKLTDDFAYSADFDQLYTELTGTIAIWIEENGLQ
ncbi:DUF1896 domain-containing protein [Flavobacterium sp. LHD-80]|uniref:DUF1896 domain-containing protein n=1 Tax=unclassified Flavobacterium TaxID=196869 RepID=UPI0027DF6C76|nr:MULTISPECIES: DUF1896 domain-containing protein [unclassified Flavobacterium]MDQ6472739.1 DUF1896 domain-containing protein [Flavobacterium sp. LHD-80]MDQ6532010.1 DUF1896 domain-containing protein [Flavobacterium sp. LHD-85]